MEGENKSIVLYPSVMPNLGLAFYKQVSDMVQNYNAMLAQQAEMIINTLNSPIMNTIRETLEAQARWAETIVKAINSPFFYPQQVKVEEAEIVDNIKQIETNIHTKTLLPVTTYPDRELRTRSRLGLSILNKNCVAFKRKKLKGISLKNAEGRFLINTLLSPNLFTTDEVIFRMFNVSDIRDFSWILRNLKRKFIQNGLKIVFERLWDPNGYSLVEINILQ